MIVNKIVVQNYNSNDNKCTSDPSAGGSDDWAKAKAGVKFVYLLELRPGEEGKQI